MSNPEFEAARAALAAYDEVWTKNAGGLLLDRMIAKNSEYEVMIGRANVALVTNLVTTLPRPSRSSVHSPMGYISKDLLEARAIQANSYKVHHRGCVEFYYPGYKVGERKVSSKISEILLAIPTPIPTPVVYVSTQSEADAGSVKVVKHEIMTKDLEELKAKSDEISDMSPKDFVNAYDNRARIFIRDNDLPIDAKIRRNRSLTLASLDDNDFRSFQVMPHLFQLAVAFDRADKLDSALAVRAELPEVSPLEEFTS